MFSVQFRFSSIAAVAVLAASMPAHAADTFVKGDASNKVVSVALDASMAGSKIVVLVGGKSPDHQN